MKKLKILKGEVREFIDTIKNIGYTEFMGERAEIRSLMGTEDIWDIIDFYSQPFKSEMITEYFEGWKQKNDGYEWSGYNEDGTFGGASIEFQIPKVKLNNRFTIYGGNSNLISFPIGTLSQFITNYVQTGIKLTWKEK